MGAGTQIARFRRAAPFWLSLAMIPLVGLGAWSGGWYVLLPPIFAWILITGLDAVTGENRENADPATPAADLFWYRLITLLWMPLQTATVYGAIWYVAHTNHHLSAIELIGLFFGIGVMAGTIGIVYAHELMHQSDRLERWLGDLLLALVLYAHFRSEHLLVHHRYVGTPRDAVSARYNEGFHRFFFRVLRESAASAWAAERAMQKRAGRAALNPKNPFWRYGLLQALALAAAFGLGGWLGLALFIWQALVAIWQLELTNYIEHYGLSRRYLGEGKYEHIQPHHSWNAAHRASNWLMINLQRHSDHHYKPDRRFPLLQTYSAQEAPQLPLGYPAMASLALIPPLWRRVMNPKVRAWRRQFYPDIEDWTPYNRGSNPIPRGAA